MSKRPPRLPKIKRSRTPINEFQQQLEKWINENSKFNIEPFVEQWNVSRAKATKEILAIVIDHMSISDALTKVNETLRYGFNMTDATIDLAQSNAVIGKFFKISLAMYLTKKSPLSKTDKDLILSRYIAREFPTNDNVHREIRPYERSSDSDTVALSSKTKIQLKNRESDKQK